MLSIFLGILFAVAIVRALRLRTRYRERADSMCDFSLELAQAYRQRNRDSVATKTDESETGGRYEAVFAVNLSDREVDDDVVEDVIRELSKWFNIRGLESKKATLRVQCDENQRNSFGIAWETQVLANPRVSQLASIGCEFIFEYP